jgi:hypothetical protein
MRRLIMAAAFVAGACGSTGGNNTGVGMCTDPNAISCTGTLSGGETGSIGCMNAFATYNPSTDTTTFILNPSDTNRQFEATLDFTGQPAPGVPALLSTDSSYIDIAPAVLPSYAQMSDITIMLNTNTDARAPGGTPNDWCVHGSLTASYGSGAVTAMMTF